MLRTVCVLWTPPSFEVSHEQTVAVGSTSSSSCPISLRSRDVTTIPDSTATAKQFKVSRSHPSVDSSLVRVHQALRNAWFGWTPIVYEAPKNQ